MIEKISEKIFDYFIINNRYYAVQKGGVYQAKNQYVNKKTIQNILNNKESFLAYQEDNNFIKWICFDFDINKEFKEDEKFEENSQTLYSELLTSIKKLIVFLKGQDIDYLLEFSGNRGIHVWIMFDSDITRQDGYIIFSSIFEQSNLELNRKKFSLDKYPKSDYSSSGTDKGTGVKIPLSFHQKSKKYAVLFREINEFTSIMNKVDLDSELVTNQYKILNEYKKQNKVVLFEKLAISEEILKDERKKEIFLNSTKISFATNDLKTIVSSLANCKYLNTIFLKDRPNEKESRAIVGLLGQLKSRDNSKIGQKLLFEFFMSKERAVETIIKQRLFYSDRFCPPTCDYFRNEYGDTCKCDGITQTPLEFLDNFSYTEFNIFDFTEEIFFDIKKAQKKYTRQNDEISLFHTMNNLKKFEYFLMKDDIQYFLYYPFSFNNNYSYIREEEFKDRLLYSITARDKIITTFAIKVLDSIFYKEFSSRSFGYRFNPSFRQNDIFENWLKQWNHTFLHNSNIQSHHIPNLLFKSKKSLNIINL